LRGWRRDRPEGPATTIPNRNQSVACDAFGQVRFLVKLRP